METSRQLLNLALSAVNGHCNMDAAFEKILETVSKNRCAVELLDVLNSLDVETSVSKEVERKQRLIELINKCNGTLIPEEIMAHSIASLEDNRVKTRIVRLKTKLLYKQTKFNLLHEEPEGFILLFDALMDSSFDSRDVPKMVACVQRLTAEYNLDPRRVFDMILHCFEFHVEQYAFFIDLLRALGANGNMLNYVITLRISADPAAEQTEAGKTKRENVSDANLSSFFDMTAILVYYGFADLSFLLSNMLPSFEEMTTEMESAVEAGNSWKGDVKPVMLNEVGDDPHFKDDDSVPDEGEIDSPGAPTVENHKVRLLHSLIKIGHWTAAKTLLDQMPAHYATRFAEICVAMCDFVSYLIDPFYLSVSDHVSTSTGQLPANHLYMAVEKRCECLAEFISDVLPILLYCETCFMCDVVAFVKVVRLCRAFLVEADERKPRFENEISILLNVCCTTLLPSLTLLPSNCSASEEMWFLLRHFPYKVRHSLYNEWANPGSANPLVLEKRNEVLNQARYVMKRLSKETMKQTARLFGRLCHSYPVVVLDMVLNQVQQFENLVDPVVESMRYLTSLSYDVLSYCILRQLSNPEKQRLKLTDASVSSWLQTLCSFTGSIFKKYNIDIECLLQYVCHQLQLNNSVDLLILYDVVKSMSGIEASSGVTTDQQLDAYSGGDLLKMEHGFFGRGRNMKRSVLRLKQAIMQEDLIVNLCVRMAARRPRIVYSEAIVDVKVAGRMYDQCQDTLIQFVSFLILFVEPEEYMRRIPLVPELVEDCGLDVDVAMFIARPNYSYMIKERYGAMLKADDSSDNWTIKKKVECYTAACSEVLDPLAEAIPSLVPPDLLDTLSPKFFVLFWTLSTGDISVPNEMYKTSTDRLRHLIEKAEKPISSEDAISSREKTKYANHLAKMKEEHQGQTEHVSLVKERLAMDKDLHIPDAGITEFISSFIANCVYQRCIFSDTDAIFCHRFIEMLHFIKEFNFPTMAFYDMLFYDIAPLVLSFTEYEANRFGRFLASTFDMLLRWHMNQETYEKECIQYPGFHIGILWDSVEEEAQWLSHDNYRALLYTWQFRITRSMLNCLMEDSFIAVRNSLLILTKMLPVFPRIQSIAAALASEATRIQDTQKDLRPDLSVLAASYLGRLKLLEKQLVTTPVFIPVQEDALPLSTSSEFRLDNLLEADSLNDSTNAIPKKPSEAKVASRGKTQRNADKEASVNADKAPSASPETADHMPSPPISQPSSQKVTEAATKSSVTATVSDHSLKKTVKCPPVKLLSRRVDNVQPGFTVSPTVPATATDSPSKTAASSGDSPSRPKADPESGTTTSGSRFKSAKALEKPKKEAEQTTSVVKEASSKLVKDSLAPGEAKKGIQPTPAVEATRRRKDSLPVKLRKPLDSFGKARQDVTREKPSQAERPKADAVEVKRETKQAVNAKESSTNQASTQRKRHISESSAQDGNYKIGKTSVAPGEPKAGKEELSPAETFPRPRLRIRTQKPPATRSEAKPSQSNEPPSVANDKERKERPKKVSESSLKVTERLDQSLPIGDTLDHFIVVDTSHSSNEEGSTAAKSQIPKEKTDTSAEKERSAKTKGKDGSAQTRLSDGKPVESTSPGNVSAISSGGEYDTKKKRRKLEPAEAVATESPSSHRDTVNNSKPLLRLRSHARLSGDNQSTDAPTVSKQRSEEDKKEKRTRMDFSSPEEKRRRADPKRAERSSEKSVSQKIPRRDSPAGRSSRHRGSGRGRESSGNRRPRERAEHYTRSVLPYVGDPSFEIPFDSFQEQSELHYPETRESDLYMQSERSDRRYQLRSFWAEEEPSHVLSSSNSPEKYSRHGAKRRKTGRR